MPPTSPPTNVQRRTGEGDESIASAMSGFGTGVMTVNFLRPLDWSALMASTTDSGCSNTASTPWGFALMPPSS